MKKEVTSYLVPLNFKQKLTFFIFTARGIFEGLLAAGLVAAIVFPLTTLFASWIRLGIFLVLGLLAFVLVAKGFYGEPFSKMLLIMIDPSRHKQRFSLRRMYSKPVKGAPLKVQDVVKEEHVRDGFVITKNDPPRYVKIIEIFPINFRNLDPREKETLVFKLSRWYKIAPRTFQLKILTNRSNPSEHIEIMRETLAKEKVPAVREVGQAYIKHVQEIARKHAIAKRFFLVFSSDGIKGGFTGEDDAMNKLNVIARECASFYESNGHGVRRFKSTHEEDEFLREVLFETYNRKSCNYDTMGMRRDKFTTNLRAYHKVTRQEAENAIPDSYYISPRGLDLSKPDYAVCDGMYRVTYYIEGDSIPNVINPGWLDWPLERGIDMDVFFKDKEADLTRTKLRTAINTATKTESSFKGESTVKDFMRAKGQAVQQILMVKNNGERLFSVQIYVTVHAHTVKQLTDLTRYVESMFESNGMRANPLRYRQGQAFHATRMLNAPISAIEPLSERIVGSVTAAAMYPISAFQLNDYTGFCLGQNRDNKSAVFINNFNTAQHPNANMLILGSSGYGKTFTIGLLAARTRMRSIPVFIIAPIKGVEFYRLAQLFGGTVIRISPSSKDRINILDIKIPDYESEIAISGDIVSQTSLLLSKVGSMRTFFKLIYPDISFLEEKHMDIILREVYADKGITDDNASLYIEGTTIRKEMPTLGDVAEKIKEKEATMPELKTLSQIMAWFTEGSGVGFNGQTNVDLKTGFTVLDISELKKIDPALVPLGMYIASNIVRGEIEEDRTRNKMLIIDEFWTMCGATSDDSASEFLLEWAKVIRGYGGSIVMASQDMSDLFSKQSGTFGKGILNACKTLLLHGMESQQAAEVQDVLGLTDEQTLELSAAEQGDVLLCSGSGSSNRVPIKVIASELEKQKITTDARLLREIVKNEKEKKSC